MARVKRGNNWNQTEHTFTSRQDEVRSIVLNSILMNSIV